MSSVHYQCLTAVQTTIQGLDLTGIDDTAILVKKLPLARVIETEALSLPVILITPTQAVIDPSAGNNVFDDIGYGVLVSILYADNQESTCEANLDTVMLAKETISKAFRQQRLTGVSESIQCRIEERETFSASAYRENLLVSSLVIRAICRETRGTT